MRQGGVAARRCNFRAMGTHARQPSPSATARRAIAKLVAAGSARRAAGMRRYFRAYDDVHFHGVALLTVRRIARDIWTAERHRWDVRTAAAFTDRLVRAPELETKSVGILVLGRWSAAFPRGLLATVRRWLADGHLATWAAVDLVASTVLTPLVRQYPTLAPRLVTWTRAQSPWVRRAAAVTFVPLARRGERLPYAYRVVRALAGDDHDLIHKATGWLLREAGKTDMARLEAFLRAEGPRLSRTTVRYAIERFPVAARRQLLEATR